MSFVTFNASNPTVQIPRSGSITAETTATWTHPGTTAFRMTKLELVFTPAQTSSRVRITNNAGSTVYVDTQEQTVTANAEIRVEVPAERWAEISTETLRFYFYRRQNFNAIYSNVHLELTYQAAAGESGVTIDLVDAGQAQTVQLINADADVWHKVTWTYGTVTSGEQTYTSTQRQPSWAIPAASLPTVYAAVTDRQYLIGTVTVSTYLGNGDLIGTTTYYTRLTIPWNSDTRPSLSVTHEETLDAVGQAISQAVSGYDVIAGHTDITITPTASGQYGAGIDVIKIYTDEWEDYCESGDEETYAVDEADTWIVRIRATDTRGIWTEETITLTPMAVSPPAVTALTGTRWSTGDAGGRPDDEGSYLQISWTAAAGSPSSQITAAYAVLLTGSETPVATGSAGSGTVYTGGVLRPERGYKLRLTVTDAYGQSSTAEVDISSALYTIHRLTGGQGVAFGQAASRQGVEIRRDWPLYTHGSEILMLILDEAHPPGSALMTIDGDWDPNTELPGEWARLGEVTVGSVQLHTWIRTR